VAVSALFPVSLITLTHDDATASQPKRRQSASVLSRVADGDARAVRECIDQFGGLVWSIARRMSSNRVDIEQVVREIFADVWRNAARYDPEQGSEEIFITMIARRRLIDRMRRAARRGRARASGENAPLGWGDPASSTSVCYEARAARRALRRLRPEQRMVLELGVLQGLSHMEIADRLQMPLDTVKTLMARGLIRMREAME